MAVKALIMAAGVGSRLQPLTDHTPKCLLPINGRPLLDNWICRLSRAGAADIWINTHHLRHRVRSYLNHLSNIHESYEPILLGSAGTIADNPQIATADNDEIIIIYADGLTDISLVDLLTYHRHRQSPLTMALTKVTDPTNYGMVHLDDNSIITKFTEKPQTSTTNLANTGIFIMSGSTYKEIASTNQTKRPLDLSYDILPQYIGRVVGYIHTGYYNDIGTTERYAEAQRCGVAIRKFMRNKAVFIDRDNTIIQSPYPTNPKMVKLVNGVGEQIKRLLDNNYKCVLVTNQAAVGRGLVSPEMLDTIHCELQLQLSRSHARLDHIYYAPYASTTTDQTIVEDWDRKPGPGMLWQAMIDHGIDLSQSWMIGDQVSDQLAGTAAGCSCLILSDSYDFKSAVDHILAPYYLS